MKKTTVTQSFMFSSFPFASLFLVFMALNGVSIRHRMKYKGFNEASLSHTQTASPFTALSFQGSSITAEFYGGVIKQRKDKWSVKNCFCEGRLPFTWSFSQQVGQHRVRQPGPKPGGQAATFVFLTYLFAQQQNKIRNIMKFKCSIKCTEEFPQNHSFKSFFEEFDCSPRVKSL